MSTKDKFSLEIKEGALVLSINEKNPPTPIIVDFLAGRAHHRHEYGGGKGQLIAKAVGLNKFKNPVVYDVTAGLGSDAFVLATLGCEVTMIERSPIIAALLKDGLKRLYANPVSENIHLRFIEADAIEFLNNLGQNVLPDVIYLDPMFPERKKSALVKKEMRVLREIVGEDLDANALLRVALTKAKKRVVVKRSRSAPPLEGPEPDVVYTGKSSRFDVYTNF